jgi:immune inhibitor A
MFLTFIPLADSVPLHPETSKKLADEGRLKEYTEKLAEARLRGVDKPEPVALKHRQTMALAEEPVDTAKVVVLLVEFPDLFWGSGTVAPYPHQFDSILFSTERYNPTGSMTEYYLENSYGNFLLTGDVYGIYMMPHDYSYYVDGQSGTGSNFPQNTKGLTLDAVVAADADIDYSQYDSFGPLRTSDGIVDAIVLVHAGVGGEESGEVTDIHSHKWTLGQYAVDLDGVTINVYTVQPEENEGLALPSAIGVFSHEYCHVMGAADLYDIDYTPETSDGLGNWTLMGLGNYNAYGKIPAHMDAWTKTHVGFVEPIEITENSVNVHIPQAESEPAIYKVWKDGIYSSEYFLVENRQRVGFDSYIPSEGLLIYHVDDATTFHNEDVEHYHVALEQADGLFNLEYTLDNNGDVGDPYPGSFDVRSFDDLSLPNSRAYDGSITQVSVWDISDSDSLMTANFDIEWSRPHFDMDSLVFVDAGGNRVLDLGESAEIYFYLRNDWLTDQNVTVNITSKDLDFDFVNPTVFLPLVEGDGAVTVNTGSPIGMTVPAYIKPTYDSFYVTIEPQSGLYGAFFEYEQQLGEAEILVIDDDRWSDFEDLYLDDLYRHRVPADIWPKNIAGSPPSFILSSYETVFWFTGDTAESLLDPADISAMKQYLDNNGNLFLTGQTLATELHNEDSAFMADYLHTVYDGLHFYNRHYGIDGSRVGNGINIEYYGWAEQIYFLAGEILPYNGGVAEFRYRNRDSYTAVSYVGNHKTLFFNFGYEAVDQIQYRFDSRDTLLNRILLFFNSITTDVEDYSDPEVLPAGFNLHQNYPNPFNPFTVIKYTIINRGSMAETKTVLKIYNILGREVKTLVNTPQPSGEYSVTWDGTDNDKRQVASGIYLYSLSRGDERQIRKMILLK